MENRISGNAFNLTVKIKALTWKSFYVSIFPTIHFRTQTRKERERERERETARRDRADRTRSHRSHQYRRSQHSVDSTAPIKQRSHQSRRSQHHDDHTRSHRSRRSQHNADRIAPIKQRSHQSRQSQHRADRTKSHRSRRSQHNADQAKITPVSSIAAQRRSSKDHTSLVDRSITPIKQRSHRIWWIFFLCVLFLLCLWTEKWYYIFVWKLRKCEKMWATSRKCVFYSIFKNTTKY